MRRLVPYIFIGIMYLLFLAPFVYGQVLSTELSMILQTADPEKEIPVIVTLSGQVDPTAIPGKTRAEKRRNLVKALKSRATGSQERVTDLLSSRGVKKIKRFWIFNGLAFSARPSQIAELAAEPGIAGIDLDGTLQAPVASTAAAASPEWNLVAVGADSLWGIGFTGVGTVVAGMDTGVDAEHPDLAGNWRGGSNSWFDPNGEHATPYDSDGHGTRTMGLLVGGEAGGSSIGMAPGAEWIAVKIFDDAGSAPFSAIHAGFQWLLDPDGDPATDDAPDVINNSWGLRSHVDQCVTDFQADIQVLKAADIAVIFAAGNEGPLPATSISPANYPESLAVGATDSNLNIVNASSRGPSACDGSSYPELVAPGYNVRTSDLTFGGLFPDSYVNVSGTSFAAPHISGGFLLLRSAFPALGTADIESAMQQSATDLGQLGRDNDFGAGQLDLLAAFNDLLNPSGCSDADADGFFAEASCGTAVDCNDLDATINPVACDIKRDGIDQDCDGADRQKGKSCPVPGSDGGSTGGQEGKGNTCSDGLDNDGDGLTDCADPDCSRNKACR